MDEKMNLKDYVGWIKLPPKYIFALSIVSGFVLFGPTSINKGLGLDLFLNDYRKFVGVFFLLTVFLLFAHIIGFLKERYEKHKNNKKLRKRLFDLTDEEKKVLSQYLDDNTRTEYFNFTDGVILGLVDEYILYRVSNSSDMPPVFPFNIQPWAWDYLRKHPELLK